MTKQLIPHLRRRVLLAASLLPLLASTSAMAAEPWPARPIKWVVPYLAGTGPDTTARIVDSQARVDVQTQQVQLSLTIDSGPLVHIGPLRITGTERYSLEHMVAEGTFREDLFYRVSEITLNIPPLRNRGQDNLDPAVLRAGFFIGVGDQRLLLAKSSGKQQA